MGPVVHQARASTCTQCVTERPELQHPPPTPRYCALLYVHAAREAVIHDRSTVHEVAPGVKGSANESHFATFLAMADMSDMFKIAGTRWAQ
eukprot:6492168-Amphidinium_carterae.8